MEGDRHRYHDLIEELHIILNSKSLTFEQLENLREEIENLLGRVSFHSNKMMLEQTDE